MTRGLAMHQSLLKHCSAFHLYMFSFDSISFEVLSKLNLPHVTVIGLDEFEDEELLRIKPTRSSSEYCWTCTPTTILYCIQKYHLDNCTYIDADLLFYNDPKVLIDEMGDNSVLITEHRYTPKYDQTQTSGKYCVQFVCFKNDKNGMCALNWWRNACIEWCYNRIEDGKFGDQKYLDDWTTRFEGVHELKHIGGGVAPWNVQQYQFKEQDDFLFLKEKNGKYMPLVFYHFHGLKFFIENMVQFCPHAYTLSDFVKTKIYFPYIVLLHRYKSKVAYIDSSFDPNAAKNLKDKPYMLKDILHVYKKALLTINIQKMKFAHKEVMAQRKLNFEKLSSIIKHG